MNRRFKKIELIKTVETSNLNSKRFLDLNTFKKLPGISANNQFLKKFEIQYDLRKKNICFIIKLNGNIFPN